MYKWLMWLYSGTEIIAEILKGAKELGECIRWIQLTHHACTYKNEH